MVTRMPELRADARRATVARRERAAASPVRLTVPILSAVVVIGAAALTSVLIGLPLLAVLGITLAVAVLGAVVAHRPMLNVLAGVTLLVVRPFSPGERVRLPATEDGGPLEAEILRVGLANTTLCTGSGLLVVPNSRMLPGSPKTIMQA
jgi:small-conductance mechanosensitive channel